jgi:hypothetical protein
MPAPLQIREFSTPDRPAAAGPAHADGQERAARLRSTTVD